MAANNVDSIRFVCSGLHQQEMAHQDGDTRNLIQHDNSECPVENTTTTPSQFLHKRLDNYPMAH